MASMKRKSAAVAIAIVGVAGLTLASAAQLNLNSASLGAGTDVVAACQTDEIGVAFTSAYDADLEAYATSEVTLSGVLASCVGQEIQVTVADDAGVELSSGSGTAVLGANAIALDDDVDAELIELVAVVISG